MTGLGNQWRVGELQFVAKNDGNTVRLAAWVNGIWALDFRVFEDDDKLLTPGWMLTHIPTTYATLGILESLENAQSIVRHVDDLGDWNFTEAKNAISFDAGMRALCAMMPNVAIMRRAVFHPGFYFDRKIVQ